MIKPTKQQAQEAVRTLIQYITSGRQTTDGLSDTPSRVIRSYDEIFSGYNIDINSLLNKKFCDIANYDDVILLKKIDFSSMCEHHILPFIGTVDIAYLPKDVVLGVSKLARIVDMFARRLQIQERMTAEIACILQEHLKPKGVAVRIEASHTCISCRGVKKIGSMMESIYFTGEYKNCLNKRQEFLASTRS